LPHSVFDPNPNCLKFFLDWVRFFSCGRFQAHERDFLVFPHFSHLRTTAIGGVLQLSHLVLFYIRPKRLISPSFVTRPCHFWPHLPSGFLFFVFLLPFFVATAWFRGVFPNASWFVSFFLLPFLSFPFLFFRATVSGFLIFLCFVTRAHVGVQAFLSVGLPLGPRPEIPMYLCVPPC